MHGVKPTLLPPEPDEATEGLRAALDHPDPTARREAVRAVVADHPTFLGGWATLADLALQDGDPVAAYAFARTGYHRGLDRIRKHGWGGQGPVPWEHEPNRGFLCSVHRLMLAADAIGEEPERERCRTFLTELDPDDALGVRRI